MGQLSITVGNMTATFEFNDVRGRQLLRDYVAAYGGPTDGSNQEQLDWVARHLAQHVRGVAKGFRRSSAAEAAASQAEQGLEQW